MNIKKIFYLLILILLISAYAEDSRTSRDSRESTTESTPSHESTRESAPLVSTDVITISNTRDSRVASESSSRQQSTPARKPQVPVCNDYCRANIHYIGKLTNRGICEYTLEPCEFRCNSKNNKCNSPPIRQTIAESTKIPERITQIEEKILPAEIPQKIIERDVITPQKTIQREIPVESERKFIPIFEQDIRVINIDTAVKGGKKVYIVDTAVPVRLFGLFNVNMPVTTVFDDETRQRIESAEPWWSFLVKDKKTYSECNSNSDCLKYEDGNLCNGILYCDKQNPEKYMCKINPSTILSCYPSNKPCQISECNPNTGVCELINEPEGKECNSGYHNCYKGDHCTNGECVIGEWDFSNPDCQCKNNADCAKFENDNLCDGTLFCNKVKNKCELDESTKIYCPTVDEKECITNICQPKTGKCELTNVDDKLCNDGSECTQGDYCKAGECLSGINTCQCEQDTDCLKYDDKNLCNGVSYCNKAKGICEFNSATIVNCETVNDGVCFKNTCNSQTGKCEMTNLLTGTECEADNLYCTKDYCEQGKCKTGTWNYNDAKCQCQNQEDCKKYDEPCKIHYCDMETHQCVINPANTGNC